MKKYLITILLIGALFTMNTAMAQKHRHNPKVVNTTSVPDTMGIEAYSDTTSTDTAGVTSYPTNYDDDWDDEDVFVDHFSFKDLRDLLGIGVGGGLIAGLAIFLVMLFLLAPFLIIILIIYLIFRNRRQRYQLAEKAMESGQQIPEELVRTEQQSDEYLWKKGIKNIFLGIGIAVLCYSLGADPLSGIGWLVSFYGIGQAVIAKTSINKRNDDMLPPSNDLH